MDRRRILTGAVGASIAAHFDKGWVRPVVSSVVLPAHATCSPDGLPSGLWKFELVGDYTGSFQIDLSSRAGPPLLGITSEGQINIEIHHPEFDTQFLVEYINPTCSYMTGRYRTDGGPPEYPAPILWGTWTGTKLPPAH